MNRPTVPFRPKSLDEYDQLRDLRRRISARYLHVYDCNGSASVQRVKYISKRRICMQISRGLVCVWRLPPPKTCHYHSPNSILAEAMALVKSTFPYYIGGANYICILPHKGIFNADIFIHIRVLHTYSMHVKSAKFIAPTYKQYPVTAVGVLY